MVSWLPGGGFLATVGEWLFGPKYGFLCALPLMAAITIASLLLTYTRCPECRKPIHAGSFFHNSWSKKCLHCGLPIGAADPPPSLEAGE
jgi:hypothetical protein